DTIAGGFPTDNGVLTFNVPTIEQGGWGSNQDRRYFVVAKFAGTALPTHKFEFTVTGLTVTGHPQAQSPGLPSATLEGFTIEMPEFNFVDQSPAQAEKVFLTFVEVCQALTIGYPAGTDHKPSSINLSSLGTAHEVDDLDNVQLWYDQDDNGSFDDQADTLVDTQVFTQDDGTVSFSLASHANFQAGDTRRFFVVYNLNANADDLETFRCYLSDMGSAPLGGIAIGLPLPSAAGTPGLEVSAAILFGIMNGPLAPVSV